MREKYLSIQVCFYRDIEYRNLPLTYLVVTALILMENFFLHDTHRSRHPADIAFTNIYHDRNSNKTI